MKLYVYDHCPFCTRARMAAALRGVATELVYLPNDDEDTPIRLIGAKQLPILQKEDGSHMGESLDIVRYFYRQDSSALDEAVRPEIQAWVEAFADWGNRLIMPHDVQLDLPEFAAESSVAYFKGKKEAWLEASFEQLLQETPRYLAQAQEALRVLDDLIVPNADYVNGAHLSMEDILVFPLLRNLSMVKGAAYPDNVAHYVRAMSQAAKIPLFFDRAV
ncbi:glutaredoxin 2 [Kingella denitrificans]|uniref:glutaredoxin 2 n=1 Tax=Kingella denitrificans TaxID=502 RepID=UPI00288A2A5C|nr:glutaredoxin 2 [Kingella denitrificans]